MDPRAISESLSAIASGGLRAREEAFARLLTELTPGEVSVLLGMVEHGPFPLRNAVLELFQRMGGERLERLLKPHLEEASPPVRLFLAQVFRHLKDRRFVPLLLRWLKDPDPNIRAEVCDALGMIADPAAIPALKEVVEEDPWVAGSALIALGRFPQPEIRPLLLRALTDEELCLYGIIAIGLRRDPELLPEALALGNQDPTWIPVLLENLGALLWELPDEEVQELLNPPEAWIEAAREHPPLSREPGKLKVLKAFRVEEAALPLVQEYLGGAEEAYLLETLSALPGVARVLKELLPSLKGDEEVQRWTQLWLRVSPENQEFLYYSLTHPCEDVRLEVLLHWEKLPEKPLDLLLPLLTDPDTTVRHQAFAILKGSLSDPRYEPVLLRFLSEETLPRDLIPLIVAEAPLSLVHAVRERLSAQEERSQEGEELLFYAEFRADPGRFFQRVRLYAQEGEEEWLLKALELLRRLPDPRVPRLLEEILPLVPPPLAYAVSEALIQHPYFQVEEALKLLRLSLPEESLVPLLHALNEASQGVGDLFKHLPPLRNPLCEWEVLKLLLRTDPGLGRERFQQALNSGIWFLELEGARGLCRLGEEEAVLAKLSTLSPQGRELVEKELKRL